MSIWTVGWPSEFNTARSTIPGTRAHDFFDLAGSLLECPEIIAKQLDRVLALYTGCRLFDIIFDILRKVELHPGELGIQCRVDLLRQLFLVDVLRPTVERFEWHEEFGIEEASSVGSVVGTSVLRNDGDCFREPLDHSPHPVDITIRLLEGDRGRQGRANPEISFLELGQEF